MMSVLSEATSGIDGATGQAIGIAYASVAVAALAAFVVFSAVIGIAASEKNRLAVKTRRWGWWVLGLSFLAYMVFQ